MTVSICPLPKMQFNQGGIPLAGGKLFTYASGTTNKLATYTDGTGGTPNTNPIVLDANGQCDIWLSSNSQYTFVLSPSTDTDPPTNSYWTVNGISATNSASLIYFIAAATGAVTRTVQNKERDIVSVNDFGAVGNGSTDDISAFNYLPGGLIIIPSPTTNYKLSANWTPAASDITFIAAGDTQFSTSHPDLNSFIPYESSPGPMWCEMMVSKTYGSAWVGSGNIFQMASYAQANVATVPVVALYGQGEAKAANSKAWGLNTVGFANNASGTAIGHELNCGVLAGGGTAYGLVIASSGAGGQPENAIQIDANQTESQYKDGFFAHFSDTSSRGCITNAVFRIGGGGGASSTCQKFLYASGVVASVAEIDLPSFLVTATVASTVNRIKIQGSSTGNDPLVRSSGSDANSNTNIAGQGSGGVGLYDGALNAKLKINTTGMGFYGASPVAKQTITGSRASGSALSDFLSKLDLIGIITNGTSA